MFLLSQELSGDRPKSADDLMALEGMTDDIAQALLAKGVVTREDLAEQATDDIVDGDALTEATAGELIMKARAHWFDQESK